MMSIVKRPENETASELLGWHMPRPAGMLAMAECSCFSVSLYFVARICTSPCKYLEKLNRRHVHVIDVMLDPKSLNSRFFNVKSQDPKISLSYTIT